MSIKKNVLRFWKVFKSEQSNLEKALLTHQHEEVKEIKKILSTYFEELCNCALEIEEEEGIFELTFLTEQDKNAQLIGALLKQLAPKEVQEKWIIHSSLPALSKKAIHTIVKLKGQEYGLDDFTAYYEVDEHNRCINLQIYCDAFSVIEPNKAEEIGMYMLQMAIGEVALEAYINQIEVVDSKPSGNAVSLSHLYEWMLDVAMEQKWSEYQDAVSIYRAFHVSEDALKEEVRKDMKMIITLHPLLISECVNDEYYQYHQFFDLGGEFGYLYYPHEKKEANDAYIRQTLEKQLHQLLYPLGIARSIGGAIGTKYAYIDLAIFDKEQFLKVLPKINEKLEVKLSYRSFEE